MSTGPRYWYRPVDDSPFSFEVKASEPLTLLCAECSTPMELEEVIVEDGEGVPMIGLAACCMGCQTGAIVVPGTVANGR